LNYTRASFCIVPNFSCIVNTSGENFPIGQDFFLSGRSILSEKEEAECVTI